MSRGWAAAAVTAVLLVLSGCGGTAVPPSAAASPTPSTTVAASPAPVPTAKADRPGPQPLPATTRAGVTSVAISAIGVHTRHLEKLGLDGDGALAAPKDPARAGWYADGTVPGDVGPAVIAGHIDSTTGPAVFYELRLVAKGDTVRVGLSDGRTKVFTVDRVITTAKKGFPTEAVFGPTPDAELRLITCGGPYDRTAGGYLDNTVVFATLR